MLEITTVAGDIYDPRTNRFIEVPACTLLLEHSLISLAKWESKWHMPYFDNTQKTPAQELDYIRCMVIGPIKYDYIFDTLSADIIHTIREYINNPMTATTFRRRTSKTNSRKEATTAETIYAHMFSHNIPIECQKWHLNRLLTLLRVCDLQNAPREKMTKKQTAAWNAEQNAARRAKYNTRG